MRRLRERKEQERVKMAQLIQSLEAQLRRHAAQQQSPKAKALDGQNSTRLAKSRVRELNFRLHQLHQLVYVLREENVWLETQLDKYKLAAEAIQALVSVDEMPVMALPAPGQFVLPGFEWVRDVMPFLPSMTSSQDAAKLLSSGHLDVIRAAVRANKVSLSARSAFGWSNKAAVVEDQGHFTLNKSFEGVDMEEVVTKSWRVVGNITSKPVLYFMYQHRQVCLVRQFDENAVVLARNMFSPVDGDFSERNKTVYLASRTQTSDGYVLVMRTLEPTDDEAMRRILKERHGAEYMRLCYGSFYTRHPGESGKSAKRWRLQVAGHVAHESPRILRTWVEDAMFALLRWENLCVRPLCSLLIEP